MKTFGYSRAEKLKQTREIDALFQKGKWRSCGDLRVICLKNTNQQGVKIGVSVSKKIFKKAVHRNRIKRLLRDCYRLHKPIFAEAFGPDCLAMLFWVSAEMPANRQQVEQEFLKLCAAKK